MHYSSIVDSNINTIIAGVVLYLVGTGVVKGFALTLVIGVTSKFIYCIICNKTFNYMGYKYWTYKKT